MKVKKKARRPKKAAGAPTKVGRVPQVGKEIERAILAALGRHDPDGLGGRMTAAEVHEATGGTWPVEETQARLLRLHQAGRVSHEGEDYWEPPSDQDREDYQRLKKVADKRKRVEAVEEILSRGLHRIEYRSARDFLRHDQQITERTWRRWKAWLRGQRALEEAGVQGTLRQEAAQEVVALLEDVEADDNDADRAGVAWAKAVEEVLALHPSARPDALAAVVRKHRQARDCWGRPGYRDADYDDVLQVLKLPERHRDDGDRQGAIAKAKKAAREKGGPVWPQLVKVCGKRRLIPDGARLLAEFAGDQLRRLVDQLVEDERRWQELDEARAEAAKAADLAERKRARVAEIERRASKGQGGADEDATPGQPHAVVDITLTGPLADYVGWGEETGLDPKACDAEGLLPLLHAAGLADPAELGEGTYRLKVEQVGGAGEAPASTLTLTVRTVGG
jgi:hypothetical protein